MKKTPPVLLISALLIPVVLLTGLTTNAQKPYPIDLLTLLGQIPMPDNSSRCYAGSTKTTDSSNGLVSIANTDPTFKQLTDQLNKIMSTAAGASAPAAPPSAGELAVMKQMGAAQTAVGRINQLTIEMGQKLGTFNRQSIDTISQGPNCPEVQQGGYAGPTCACMRAKDLAYETKRVAAQDAYLSKIKSVILDYLGQIRTQTAIVDNFEHAAKFGDALSNPVYKQLVGSVQRQALGGVVAILGASMSTWEDAAKIYANWVNAKSGSSVGCFNRQ